MKGIILAGGTGSRLLPLTKVTNKHLLPIYDKPMVYYPIMKLRDMGVDSILIVSGKDHVAHFEDLLGDGAEFGLKMQYAMQETAGGIAQALALGEEFVGDDSFVVMLGDNIYEDDLLPAVRSFIESGSKAHIFLKEVSEAQSYGVAKFEAEKIVEILEKPENPPSNLAVTGAYLYSSEVFELIHTLKPSARGELEISDVNDLYVKRGEMSFSILEGFWGDCGESIDQNMSVSSYVQKNAHIWSARQEKGSLKEGQTVRVLKMPDSVQ